MSDDTRYPVPGARHRTTETIERIDWVDLNVTIDYTSIATVRRLLPLYEAELVSEEYGNDVHFRLRLPASQSAPLQSALMDATQGQMRVDESAEEQL